jgi:hypothetical protein
VLARSGCLNCLGYCLQPAVRMFDAIDEIVRVFVFVPLIERERFETSETDNIGVADRLGRHAVFAEQFCADLLGFMMIENY